MTIKLHMKSMMIHLFLYGGFLKKRVPPFHPVDSSFRVTISFGAEKPSHMMFMYSHKPSLGWSARRWPWAMACCPPGEGGQLWKARPDPADPELASWCRRQRT